MMASNQIRAPGAVTDSCPGQVGGAGGLINVVTGARPALNICSSEGQGSLGEGGQP